MNQEQPIAHFEVYSSMRKVAGHPEVVEEAIQEVQAQVTPDEQGNVLNILFWFASLALGERDQDWLTRRFHMLDDILSETPLAKHLEELGEKRGEERERERSREEIKRAQEEAQRAQEEAQHTREEALEQMRQILSALVSAHFPALLALAQQQGERLTDTTALNLLLVQLSIAQTEEDARQYLLDIE